MRHSSNKVGILMMVLLAMSSIVYLGGEGITGYFIGEGNWVSYEYELGVNVTGIAERNIPINSSADLRSLRISGRIIGSGEYNVTAVVANRSYMLYTSVQESLDGVTAFAVLVKPDDSAEDEQDVLNDTVDDEVVENVAIEEELDVGDNTLLVEGNVSVVEENETVGDVVEEIVLNITVTEVNETIEEYDEMNVSIVELNETNDLDIDELDNETVEDVQNVEINETVINETLDVLLNATGANISVNATDMVNETNVAINETGRINDTELNVSLPVENVEQNITVDATELNQTDDSLNLTDEINETAELNVTVDVEQDSVDEQDAIDELVNETQIDSEDEEVVEPVEEIVIILDNACDKTCRLPAGIRTDSVQLLFNIGEGVVFDVDKIEYSIAPEINVMEVELFNVTNCVAEDNSERNSWNSNCSTISLAECPDDRLGCDDSVAEVHSYSKGTYAGLFLREEYEGEGCVAVNKVEVCYDWYSPHVYELEECKIAVSADGRGYQTVVSECPGFEESFERCVDVTELAEWDCSNFFGDEVALIKSEVKRSDAGVEGSGQVYWDVLRYDVEYDEMGEVDYRFVKDDVRSNVRVLDSYKIGKELTVRLRSDSHIEIVGDVDYNISKKGSLFDIVVSGWEDDYFRIWAGSDVIEFGMRKEVEFNGRVRDSKGRIVESDIQLIDKATSKKQTVAVAKHPGRMMSGVQSTLRSLDPVQVGEYDAKVTPVDMPVKEITFYNVNLSKNVSAFVNIDDVNESDEFVSFKEIYAIDPTAVKFDNATVTVTATGTSLYKCAMWNFTSQECIQNLVNCTSDKADTGSQKCDIEGGWVFVRSDLVPGEEYNITLTPDDPGFGEYEDTSFATGTGQLTFSHTIGSNDNRLLVVGATAESSSGGVAADTCRASSVTYGGTNLTKITGYDLDDSGADQCVSLWYMLNPPNGTADIVVSYVGSVVESTAGGVSLYGMKQQAPENYTTNYATGSPSSLSTSIGTITDNAWIVDVIGSGNLGTFSATGSGQVERWDAGISTAQGAGSTVNTSTAGSYSMNWSQGANRLVHVVAAFEEMGNSAPTIPTILTCDGGSCNSSFAEQVEIECSGSIDTENDSIEYNVWAYYNTTVEESSTIEFQRASGSTGTSHTIDIGEAGNDRLVVVMLDDESKPGGTFQGTVSIGGSNANQLAVVDNSVGAGNHMEMHYFTESDLGALSGSQTVSYSGGDSGWAMHVQVYYNIKDGAPFDNQIDQTSAAEAEIDPFVVDIPENGLVVFSAGHGSSGSYNDNDWDTSPTEDADDGLSPEIELIEVTDSPNPSSAILASAYWISSTSAQNNRQFRARASVADNYRGTGIIATFEPASEASGYEWDELGNHSASSSLAWNLTNISLQTGVDLKCRAIDNGSEQYTEYYEPGINLSVTDVPPDTTPPGIVVGLNNISKGYDWIYWNWTNPVDADFNSSIVYIDGVNVVNTTNNWYNATELSEGTNYTLTVHTKDHNGNVNDTDVNNTASTTISYPEIHSVIDSPDPVNVSQNITITMNVTDNIEVDDVWVEIGESNYSMVQSSGSAENWWNTSWSYRKKLNVTTGVNVPYNDYDGYTVQFVIDTTGSDFMDNGNDIRIVYWNGIDVAELGREIVNPDSASTKIRFKLQDNISASSSDSDYYLYYGYDSAAVGPVNKSDIYLWHDDASVDRESEYTQGRVDASAHGGSWANSIIWNAAGYYTYDTNDNFADSMRPTDLEERDVYIEYEEYQTGAYSSDMTSGPLVRWEGTGSGATEDSSHWYCYEMADSSFYGGYASHDDITGASRGSVVLANGLLGDFPANTWTRLGIAVWGGVSNVNINAYYNNESGGWGGYRFSGMPSTEYTNVGEFGVWLQQDAGRVRNIIARRYVEPEPSIVIGGEESNSGDSDIWTLNHNTSGENGFIVYTVFANDTIGSVVSSVSNYTVLTADNVPPASVTALVNMSQGTDWIYWAWTNPLDADFNSSIVYLDGVNVVNTTAGLYNATGLSASTNYTITVHTKDHSGNVNDTDVNSAAMTNPPANSDYPQFSNAAVNYALIGLNEYTKFSIDVSDASHNIQYVNGTIGGVVYDFTAGSGDEWYYDYQCLVSETVSYTYAAATDDGVPVLSNSTDVGGVTLECDAVLPSITSEEMSPSTVYANNNVIMNATVMDDNLNEVWISGNWSGSWQDYDVVNSSSVYSYNLSSGNMSTMQKIGWKFLANDTAGNMQTGALQEFTVSNRAPTKVSLSEIENGTITGDNTTTFIWSNANDPDEDSLSYKLEIATDSGFENVVFQKNTGSITYTLTDEESLAEDAYYWRVYSNDTYASNVSDIWEYEVNPNQAIAVSLSDALSDGIKWDVMTLPSYNLEAKNNSDQTQYDIAVSATGTTVDVYLRAESNLQTIGGDYIGVGNETFAHSLTNSSVPDQNKFKLTTNYADNLIADGVPTNTTIYLKFYLNVSSGQAAGIYGNNVTIKAVPNGASP